MKKSNFIFLESYDPLLAALAQAAERNFPEDPNTCLIKMRQFGELLAQNLSKAHKISIDDCEGQYEVLMKFRKVKKIDAAVITKLDEIRRLGNEATHELTGREEDALRQLKEIHGIAIWYAKKYHKSKKKVSEFEVVMDTKSGDASDEVIEAEIVQNSSVDAPTSGIQKKLISRTIESEPIRAILPPAPGIEVIKSQLDKAISALKSINETTLDIENAFDATVENFQAACEPFKLGIVGESRAGKSTLINALASDRIAFVDEITATPVPCVFRQGPTRKARLYFLNGNSQEYSVEEINDLLSQKRENEAWLKSVSHVEYETPSSGLKDLEIWDSPGIASLDAHDIIANRFIDKASGVIWVFHVHKGGGSATPLGPLRRLALAGKKIIGVLNGIDLLPGYSETDEQEDIRYHMDTYRQESGKPLFECIIPISAKCALEANEDNPDPRLLRLRGEIQSKILSTADHDRDSRIAHAAALGAQGICFGIGKREKAIRDRLGLYEHMKANCKSVKSDTIKMLDVFINEASAFAYQQEERYAREQAASEFNRILGQLESAVKRSFRINTDKENEGELTTISNNILKDFNDDKNIDKAWFEALGGIKDKVDAFWLERMRVAKETASGCIPVLDLISSDELYARPIIPQGITSKNRKTSDDESKEAGIVAGGSSLAVLATIAYISVPITWPITLAAVPIGLIALHIRKLAEKTIDPSFITLDFYARLSVVASIKRKHLKEYLQKEIPPRFDAYLDLIMNRVYEEFTIKILLGNEETIVRRVLFILKTTRTELGNMANHWAGDSFDRVALVSDVIERPFTVSPDSHGEHLLSSILSCVKVKLDIVTRSSKGDLSRILSQLRPEVSVRLLTSCPFENEEDVREAFGSWPGHWDARIVTDEDGNTIPLDWDLLLTENNGFTLSGSVFTIGSAAVVFSDFPFGLLAAEYEFEELWTRVAARYGQLLVKPVRNTLRPRG